MSPLGRERRKVATVRLSVAQGTLQAEACTAKGELLRKGYGNEGLACFIATHLPPLIQCHFKTMPDYGAELE